MICSGDLYVRRPSDHVADDDPGTGPNVQHSGQTLDISTRLSGNRLLSVAQWHWYGQDTRMISCLVPKRSIGIVLSYCPIPSHSSSSLSQFVWILSPTIFFLPLKQTPNHEHHNRYSTYTPNHNQPSTTLRSRGCKSPRGLDHQTSSHPIGV